jgi:glycosyltransferase involved in cell wall biosynthesis
VSLIRQFDIGIMPLPDTPFERGKCGYKLIQYMACGLPVVASPVGVNVELVPSNVGYLARTQEDWVEAIESLVKDVHMRNRLGSEGRRRVEELFCLQVQGPRFVQMLKDVVEGVN